MIVKLGKDMINTGYLAILSISVYSYFYLVWWVGQPFKVILILYVYLPLFLLGLATSNEI